MTSLADNEFYAVDLSSEDSFEEIQELESRLYSIIHYNNLSEIAPSDLPDGFKIDENKFSNELIVSLDECEASHQSKADETDGIDNQNQTGDKVLNECLGVDHSCRSTNQENNVPEVPDKTCNIYESNCYAIKDSSHGCDNIDSDIEIIDVDSKSVVNKLSINSKKDSVDVCSNHLVINCTETSNCFEEIVISSSEEELTRNKKQNQISKRKKHKHKTKNNSKSLEKHCPEKWTSSMVKFYSKISRSKLNFNSSELICKMKESTTKKDWVISNRDFIPLKGKRFRCKRCKQFGHEARCCLEPMKPIVCYMCGGPGHRESLCPHKKCLTCGRPNTIYVPMCSKCVNALWKGNLHCYICFSNHHNTDLCPEIWRAFHMTTKAGPLMVPSKQTLKQFCCNCGKQGHLASECSRLMNNRYIINSPVVSNYVGVAQVFTQIGDNLTLILKWDSRDGSSLASNSGYVYLQELSDMTGARLELQSVNFTESLTIIGSEQQCRHVISFVSTHLKEKETSFHKHKTKSLLPKKRRTV